LPDEQGDIRGLIDNEQKIKVVFLDSYFLQRFTEYAKKDWAVIFSDF